MCTGIGLGDVPIIQYEQLRVKLRISINNLTIRTRQGAVKGGRRQGRQRKRWEDNIREWTGLEFAMSQRAMENREK